MSAKGINPLRYRKVIGQRIGAARIEAKVTQVELAKLLGISRMALSSYEAGRVRVKIQVLMTLCKILNKPLGYFVHEFEKEENIYFPEEVTQEKVKVENYSVEDELNFALEMSIRNYLRFVGFKKDELAENLPRILEEIKSKRPAPVKKKRFRISGQQYM